MREWDEDDLWLRVVLCNAYDMKELAQLEEAWIELTWARDQSVGYNGNSVPYSVSAANGMSGGRPETTVTAFERPVSPVAGMTDEQKKEFYREQGKKGAEHGRKGARPRKEMTEEERERFREWGRKGAARSRELAGKA
jgi:general stress protein YciG